MRQPPHTIEGKGGKCTLCWPSLATPKVWGGRWRRFFGVGRAAKETLDSGLPVSVQVRTALDVTSGAHQAPCTLTLTFCMK